MKKYITDGTVDHPISVYAYLDALGQILYIGQSWDLQTRHLEHRRTSRWFGEVVERVILAQTLWRHNACEIEKRAIREHRPLYNIKHNQRAAS